LKSKPAKPKIYFTAKEVHISKSEIVFQHSTVFYFGYSYNKRKEIHFSKVVKPNCNKS
jgi:hypothetical protein